VIPFVGKLAYHPRMPEWRIMNQTEQDESLDEVDLDALYAMPVEVPAEAPTKRKRWKYRRYPTPTCTPAQKQALWEHQGGI
jgi:uncharacterized protein (DUF1684 family)